MISCLIALNKTSTIQDLVRYAWMGLTCTFGPVVIMCLYSSKITKYGALAGIIVGGTLSAVWEALLGQIIPIYDMTIPAALPGFLGGLLAIYLFSSYSTQS
jgi:sodium/proline symporter